MPNTIAPPRRIHKVAEVKGVPAQERAANVIQNCREHEGQQKIGCKKDKAQPKILRTEEDPIPARIRGE